MFSFTSIILVILVASSVTEGKKDCKEKLNGTIIPQYAESVIDTDAFKIVYPGNNTVDCGNYLTFLETIPPPTVTYKFPSECEYATIIFIGIGYNFYDTDVLLVPGPYLHWLVHNIDPETLSEGFDGSTDVKRKGVYVKADYLPPINPFSDHRYTFFVYCQNHYIEPNGKLDGLLTQRPAFQPKDYAKEYDLGNPFGIQYFISVIAVVDGIPFPPSLVKVD